MVWKGCDMVSPRCPRLKAFVRRFRPARPTNCAAFTSRHDRANHSGAVRWIVGLALLLSVVAASSGAQAQDERKKKIPVVDKITGGNSHQAFSGKVETVDLKRHVLEVNHEEGTGMEIFPIKNGVTVTSAAGTRMKLEQLKQGSNVIVYYEVKDDKRSVKEIVVLVPGSTEDHKKAPPPS